MINLLLAVIYFSFISLGLPDSLLGSAWPSMYQELSVPISYSGIISMIISLGTIASSLQSDRLTRRLGAGRVTAISVALTALALIGFSLGKSFPALCIVAIPYGLGAGSVDAALNNYVALHFASRHMSWLHCMWGIGASIGPYIMGSAIGSGAGWSLGYRIVGLMQIGLSVLIFMSLPLWKNKDRGSSLSYDIHDTDIHAPEKNGPSSSKGSSEPSDLRGTMDVPAALSLKQIFAIPGAVYLFIAFFCYMALEATASLWAASFLSFERGLTGAGAAFYAGLFFIGMTIGRAVSGFLTMRLSDTDMIRLGRRLAALGLILILIPIDGPLPSVPGLIILGLGCAPIYPSIIHSTPSLFGEDRSQAIIGVQMASAYIGSCLTPPIFGVLGEHIGFWLYPIFLIILLILMSLMHERLVKALSY
ncbi:MAG TPA: MFS transporter [Candidatus Avilachnospira avistercoris]|nr:MFS transporter [Candidatus Avilachnospira avistercoris]